MNVQDIAEYGVAAEVVAKLAERGFELLTEAQVVALREGVCLGESMLVAAPTSAGKTTIAELAAVQAARKAFRTVYLVSHRALAEEKYRFFKDEYAAVGDEWFDVSIATGDHTEGGWETGILVATYEKYLAMLCASGDVDLMGVVVIADEVQILSDARRGADIELLCTLIRKGSPNQVVALSATISNPDELGAWLGCKVVHTKSRDVPLRQEVWFRGRSVYCLAETDELFEGEAQGNLPRDTLDAIAYLLEKKLGPILTFTMTKPRAQELAQEFANQRARTNDGLGYVEQLELFSEPSTLVRSLIDITQKQVAFHTADLTYSERELVEQGLHDRLFDVVFATPTLASGVNFPFQTVVFDSFYRGFIRHDPWLPLAEFRNMAGRAGRLGMHERGFAILLPGNQMHFDRAKELISATVEPLHSRFMSCSLRKVVLSIIASKVVRNREEVLGFLRETLWWYQMEDRNPEKLKELPDKLDRALAFLRETQLVTARGQDIYATRLGVATASTGLLPHSVTGLLELLKHNERAFSDEAVWVPAVLHAVCASEEFGQQGQRNLPYSYRDQPERQAMFWVRARTLFRPVDAIDQMDRVTNATYALWEWIKGTPERSLRNMLPPITYGQVQQLGNDAALILEGMARVMRVPDAECPVNIPNALVSLAERLRFGVPSEILDLMKASARYSVPGFGRHRAMNLHAQGHCAPNEVLQIQRSTLVELVENEQRAEALVEALIKYFDAPLVAFGAKHSVMASRLALDEELIRRTYETVGEEYEDAVLELLQLVTEWSILRTDKDKRQGYPDFQIKHGDVLIVMECKTKQRDTATLSKDEAFAVLAKSVDFEKNHCVTLGKPGFDEMSKKKANGSTDVTLLRHQDLVEGILRYSEGRSTADAIFAWLCTPGYARLDQLEALSMPEPSV